MNPKSAFHLALMLFLLLPFTHPGSALAGEKITVGLNLSLTGNRQATGISTKEGAELLREQINSSGGLRIGNNRYEVEFVYADDESSPQKAVTASLELITKHNVLGVVGPNASSSAIPAGGIAEAFKTRLPRLH